MSKKRKTNKIIKVKLKVRDLIVLNNLARVSTALSINRVKNYIIQVSKEENALIIEKYQEEGKYGVLIRKEMNNIPENAIISIADPDQLDKMLKLYDKNEVLELYTKKMKGYNYKRLYIKNGNDIIETACHEETDREMEARKRVGKSFATKKYGEDDNLFAFYRRENPEDPNPDAVCNINLKKLNLKKLLTAFDCKYVELGAKEDYFYLKIKEKKVTNIVRTIKKEDKDDLTSIKGECEIQIQDIDCINMLASFNGMTMIEMKERFPLVLKKKLPVNRIGVNYIISITEDEEEEEE